MNKIPFNENELQVVGTYVATRGAAVPKYNTPVTPKENLDLWLKGETPLWIPTLNDFLSFTPRVVADNVARGFAFDAEPALTAEQSGGPDMFGTDWVFIPQAGGSMVRPGKPRFTNANDWREVITMPDVDSFDWETSAEINKGDVVVAVTNGRESIRQLNDTLASMRETAQLMPQLLSQSRERYAEQVDQFVTALVRLQKSMESISASLTAGGKE